MYSNEEIKRFEKHMRLIRNTLGWTEKQLGESIGVTKQTINNIEISKSKLNKAQYIALRTIINDEIRTNHKDNDMLIILLDAIVDNPENYSEEEKNEIIKKASLLSPAIITKAYSKEEVSKEYIKMLGGIGILGGSVVLGGVINELRKAYLKGKK